MRSAFTLIEVLIGIFILAFALLGIAAVFTASTKEIIDNYEHIQAQSIRKSAESFYQQYLESNTLEYGWNIAYDESISKEFRILYLTFKSDVMPNIVVTAVFKGQNSAFISDFDSYLPQNNDIIVSWYGFCHKIEKLDLQLQEFELRQPFVVLPFEKMDIKDIHKFNDLEFTN